MAAVAIRICLHPVGEEVPDSQVRGIENVVLALEWRIHQTDSDARHHCVPTENRPYIDDGNLHSGSARFQRSRQA